jgi:hypothetical protein
MRFLRPTASSRRATRFSAPRDHPPRAHAPRPVNSESIGIASHLSLPPFGYPALKLSHGHNERRAANGSVNRSQGFF